PGITGPSQLAFARESQILDQVDPHDHYVQVILPHKLQLDRLYVRRSSLRYDAKVLIWTAAAVILRRQVAVDRTTGKMRRRLRPNQREHAVQPAVVLGGAAGRSTGSLPLPTV